MVMPKRESSGPAKDALSRDMVAAVGCENNVSNQRYHGTVDKTKVGINNLII